MNKIIFLSLFSVVLSINSYFEIKEQTNDKIKINFNLQDFEVKNEQNGKVITVPGSGTRSIAGEPSLPSLSSFVILDKIPGLSSTSNLKYAENDLCSIFSNFNHAGKLLKGSINNKNLRRDLINNFTNNLKPFNCKYFVY